VTRPGIVTYRPVRRRPVLTDAAARRCRRALGAALLVGALLALGASRAAAQEAEGERYTPSARSGREAVRELAEQHFAPEWVGWAVRTARCESGWDLYAYSAGFDRRWGVWYEHVGALQVDGVTWRRMAEGDILEPAVNFAVAAYVLAEQGVRAWPWCGR
jgi:hypothetical protein